MPQYLSPGVYVEEVEGGAKPIAGVGTSTAGFVVSTMDRIDAISISDTARIWGEMAESLRLAVYRTLTCQAGLSGQEQDIVLSFIAPDLSVRANRFSEGFNLGTSLTYAMMFGHSTIATIAKITIHFICRD